MTGIPAEVVGELADAWISASRAGGAAVHCSTGLNMGRQGTLAYWLVQMLSFATGNLDREGGNIKSDSFYPNARSGAAVVEAGYHDTEFGRFRTGSLPANLLSHWILEADEPVRALIVAAGNPLLSIGGEGRLRKAFENLELLVCVDIYRNASGEMADWVLPATDQFERPDLNLIGVGLQYRPWVQYTAASVEPKAERRNEWWIFARLTQELGLPSILDRPDPDPWARLRHMVGKCGVDFDDLVREPRAVALPPTEPGRFYDDQIHTTDGRVDCCPPLFEPAIERAESLFSKMSDEAPGLKLITRREPTTHNSWFANVDARRRGERSGNRLDMHPVDAAACHVADGDLVVLSSDHGQVEVVLRLSDDLLPGVVSLAHGGGHRGASGLSAASSVGGANPNAVLPIGPGSFEPLSSQSHMTGIPVTVAPA